MAATTMTRQEAFAAASATFARNLNAAEARRDAAIAARPEGTNNADILHQFNREQGAALGRFEKAKRDARRIPVTAG
jgi:hypothetical protein